jgi:hypothetical protein
LTLAISPRALGTTPFTAPDPSRLERRIIKLLVTRRRGPRRIGYHLGGARSTVGRGLSHYRMPRLAHLDQTSGGVVLR